MINQFTTAFSPNACMGDKITMKKEGFIITATIMPDLSMNRPDQRDESFWPSQNEKDAGYCPPNIYDEQLALAKRAMEGWHNDEWFYCGIVLSVSKSIAIKGYVQREVVLSNHAASLWGIECNFPDSKNEHLTEIANELISEALGFANACLQQIAA